LGVTLLRIVTGKGPNSEKYYKSLDNLDEFIEENTIDISPQVKALIKKMVKTEPQERPDINQVLNDPWLNDFQEDNQLLLSEYEQEFIRRNKNIEETKDNKDNIININNKIDFQGDNKSISDNSEDDDYKKSFELKIIDEEDENIDLKDFLIIQGDISPKDYMNFIKRLLKIEFSEYINNEIKSKNKEGKFFFKGSKHYFKFKVGIEYDNEKNYKNDDDEFNDEKLFIKKRNLLIRGTLLKSTNGYYILRFYKKSGDIEEYYEKLNQMISILKEFI
jgi:serine/threonine protein kinase